MTILEPITTAFRKYADFGGRANRPQFWWFMLFVALISASLLALTLPTNGSLIEVGLGADGAFASVSIVAIWLIAIVTPSLAVTVRRLHDVDRGEEELLWILLPVAGWIVLGVRLAQPSTPTVRGPRASEPRLAAL